MLKTKHGSFAFLRVWNIIMQLLCHHVLVPEDTSIVSSRHKQVSGQACSCLEDPKALASLSLVKFQNVLE